MLWSPPPTLSPPPLSSTSFPPSLSPSFPPSVLSIDLYSSLLLPFLPFSPFYLSPHLLVFSPSSPSFPPLSLPFIAFFPLSFLAFSFSPFVSFRSSSSPCLCPSLAPFFLPSSPFYLCLLSSSFVLHLPLCICFLPSFPPSVSSVLLISFPFVLPCHFPYSLLSFFSHLLNLSSSLRHFALLSSLPPHLHPSSCLITFPLPFLTSSLAPVLPSFLPSFFHLCLLLHRLPFLTSLYIFLSLPPSSFPSFPHCFLCI